MSIRASISMLKWESNFFNRNIGYIIINNHANILTNKILNEFMLVQAKIAKQCTKNLNELYDLGFKLVNEEINCSYDLHILPETKPHLTRKNYFNNTIRQANTIDIVSTQKLVAYQFKLSRFCAPWYSYYEQNLLYKQWVKNAIHGKFDHICLVTPKLGQIKGLVTIRYLDKHRARIGLLAVSSHYLQQGIGTLLYEAALQWCYNKKFLYLLIRTQNSNIPALTLYLSGGAKIINNFYWLYREPNDSI